MRFHALHTSTLPNLLHKRLFAYSAAIVLTACGGSSDDPAPQEPPQMARTTCSDFKTGHAMGEGVITTATVIPASAALPEYCEIRGTLPPKTTFAVRMPTQWNNRTVYVGGGGFNGALPAANSAYLTSGFAQISSTGGNDVANTANFALDPLALNDYSYLSVHRTFQVGREIVRSFYAKNESKNYFYGCSNGGREGLIEAQRWPQDFDGIIAAAPAVHLQSLFLGFTRNNKLILSPGGNPTPAKLNTLNKAIVAACDAQDGAGDGILSQPKLCTFNPASLRCTGADSNSCLTDAEIKTATSLYGTWEINGREYLPGFYPGSEVAWDGTQTGQITASTPRYSNLFADQYVRYFVTQDPTATALTFDPVPWLPRITQLSLLSDPTNANLANFRARQGKLILYHGLADSAISPKDTEAYYQSVVQASGGQAEADKYVRAFFNPGVGHCQGGPGADTVDLLTPLVNWVESGSDPATAGITATKVTQGATVLSRPLCPYPQYPRYKGTGVFTDASSFSCTQP
jgi:hypothetical protein